MGKREYRVNIIIEINGKDVALTLRAAKIIYRLLSIAFKEIDNGKT